MTRLWEVAKLGRAAGRLDFILFYLILRYCGTRWGGSSSHLPVPLLVFRETPLCDGINWWETLVTSSIPGGGGGAPGGAHSEVKWAPPFTRGRCWVKDRYSKLSFTKESLLLQLLLILVRSFFLSFLLALPTTLGNGIVVFGFIITV